LMSAYSHVDLGSTTKRGRVNACGYSRIPENTEAC
jgi:hypothetical protein